jgi:poly(glycerol-phosphate) alpha-glucosyltransferase
MKVAILTMSATRKAGGLFYSVKNLAGATELSGNIFLQVFAGRDNVSEFSDDLATWTLKNSPIILKKMKPYSFGYMPQLFYELVKFNPDILHIHGIWSYHAFVAVKYKKK